MQQEHFAKLAKHAKSPGAGQGIINIVEVYGKDFEAFEDEKNNCIDEGKAQSLMQWKLRMPAMQMRRVA